jgi:NDP-sugar pyrophosphorylase family protein
MMHYTSIILAAKDYSSKNDNEINFLDTTINADEKTLLELAIEVYSSEYKMIVVLGSNETKLSNAGDSIIYLKYRNKTKGALISLAMSLDHIPGATPIIVASVDGIVDCNLAAFVEEMEESKKDIGILCFKSTNPDYSYIRIFDEQIVEIEEKSRVGDLATSGVFYFKDKSLLIQCIEWSLLNKVETNKLYFLAPSINFAISEDLKVGYTEVDGDLYKRFSTNTKNQ